MLAQALNISEQFPVAKRSASPADLLSHIPLSLRVGLQSKQQFKLPAANTSDTSRTESHKSSDFRLGQSLTSELPRFSEPPVRLIRASLFHWRSSLGEGASSAFPHPLERNLEELGIAHFLISLRQFIDNEQLATARTLLQGAPAYILSNPQILRFRSILAPPTVTRVEMQKANRNLEYKWLETESHKYSGQWVALDGDQLLAYAQSLRDLRNKLQMTRHARPPLIHHVR